MNESDVTPAELSSLQAISAAAAELLTAARAAGNTQTESIAACVITSLGLINVPPSKPKATYLRRVAEIIYELAASVDTLPPPSGRGLS